MKGISHVFGFFGPWVLALALIVGLLYVLPQVLLQRAAEAEGRFFIVPHLEHLGDDALYYLPRAREIYEGHFPSEVNFTEYKDKAWFVLPPLPQMITAGFLWLNAGDVAGAMIGLLFVFGIINFLCFYAAGMVFLRSRLGAAALASAALLTHAALRLPAAFYKPGVALDLIANMLPVLRRPVGELSLVRIDDPLITMPLYIAAFVLLYRFSEQPTRKRGAVLGIAAGVLTYLYLYYWLAILGIAAVLFLAAAVRAYREKIYAPLAPWAVFGGVFGLFFIPHAINFFMYQSLPGAADYVLRKGIESGRGVRLSVWQDYVFYGVLAAAAYAVLREKHRAMFRFVIAGLAAMLLSWNAQIFTGFNIDADHWWKTWAPLLLIVTATLVKAAYDRRLSRQPYAQRAAAGVLVVLMVFMFAKKTRNAAAFINPPVETVRSYSVPDTIGDAWQWMDAHLPPDATVITHSLNTATYLTIFTHTNPYLAQPVNTLASTAVLEERFARMHKIFGATPEEMEARLASAPFLPPAGWCAEPCAFDRDRFRDAFAFTLEFRPHAFLYGTTYSPRLTFDALRKNPSGHVPQDAKDRLRAHYAAYEPDWSAFPEHTYLYVSPMERLLSPSRGVPAYPELPVAFENEDVRILRVR